MSGVVKSFPGVRALDGVDLDVRAGEVHCLLGQNGAGKSRLVKGLAGRPQPAAGRAPGGGGRDVRAGEVRCLLGQNGAGKSTLIKVLAGAHQPDAGRISWRGEPVRLTDPQAAMSLGIATIYQELDLVAGLTVADNVFLGREAARFGGTRPAPPTRPDA